MEPREIGAAYLAHGLVQLSHQHLSSIEAGVDLPLQALALANGGICSCQEIIRPLGLILLGGVLWT
jgi:hypothetical protein